MKSRIERNKNAATNHQTAIVSVVANRLKSIYYLLKLFL